MNPRRLCILTAIRVPLRVSPFEPRPDRVRRWMYMGKKRLTIEPAILALLRDDRRAFSEMVSRYAREFGL